MALSTKRKLYFVRSTPSRLEDDAIKAWSNGNHVTTRWLVRSTISDSISISILLIQSASGIWKQLERRFNLSNGLRKYTLNKDINATKQNNSSSSDYYTRTKSIWEELNALDDLPKITIVTDELTKFLNSLARK